MSAHKYRCTNLANECTKALTGEVMEVTEGEEALCPECTLKLSLFNPPVNGRGRVIMAIALAALASAGVAVYFLFPPVRWQHRRTAGPSATPQVSTAMPVPAKTETPYACGLRPAAAPDVVRLLQFLKQGMNYASQKRPELAIQEFEQVLKIDPNFLGAQMNIGSAWLAMKKYPQAEDAFNRELKLIDCLKQMKDEQLTGFSYMENTGPTSGQKEAEQGTLFRGQIARDEADLHYNLACLKSRQKQNRPAILELEKALAAGRIDKKSLQTDPDLQGIRSTAEFKALMARYSPAQADSP